MPIVKSYGYLIQVGHVVEMKVSGKQLFNRQLKELIIENKTSKVPVEIIVKRIDEEKTNKQLGYYFGVVVKYAMTGYKSLGWLGMDEIKTDNELRMEGFSEVICNPSTGEMKKYSRSLSSASKKEVQDYIDWCIIYILTELGIEVPPPPPKNEEVIQ
jgi:hypothetical protein